MGNKIKFSFDVIVLMIFVLLILFPWENYFKAGFDLSAMGSDPSLKHLLGTDNLGRDLLIRIAHAIKGAVLPLWLAVFLCTIGGILFGAMSIVFEESSKMARKFSSLFKLLLSAAAAIPIGVVAFSYSVLQERAGIGPVLISLGTLFFIRSYLQVSSLYLEDQKLSYWRAHQSIGGSLLNRLFSYGLGGRWKEILFSSFCFHLQVSVAIEASLSYLGFGIQEPQASFGNILASHFDLYLKGQWQILIIVVSALLLSSQFPSSLSSIFKKRSPVIP